MATLEQAVLDMKAQGFEAKAIDEIVSSKHFDPELYFTQQEMMKSTVVVDPKGDADLNVLMDADNSQANQNFGPNGNVIQNSVKYGGAAAKVILVGATGAYLIFGGAGMDNVVKAADMGPVMHPDSLAKADDYPVLDSAIVYLQRPAIGGGVETRVDSLGIHPYYMNIITAGGPAVPYHGTWIFTPNDPVAATHAHWYLGGGAPDKGLHAIEADSVANFWNLNYPLYFDNNGTPDDDWEVVAIKNINWSENDDDPLPVELTPNSFIAAYNNGLLNLKWRTDTEVNNYGFEIYRTILDDNLNVVDAKEKIGFAPGHGNSNSPKNYEFVDPTRDFVVGNKRVYQLRQIDNDGQYEDLSPLEVNIGKEFLGPGGFEMQNPYPNPFNPMTNLTYRVIDETSIKITAYNTLGEEVKVLVNEVQKPGIYTIQFNGDANASGPYFFKIDAPGFSETKKALLTK